jgi:hypothetical protein
LNYHLLFALDCRTEEESFLLMVKKTAILDLAVQIKFMKYR